MNQKDYKVISEIIKFRKHPRLSTISDNIALDLADYFEKECPLYKLRKAKKNGILNENDVFNKKQFLKACGVDEE